ncbi:hypothetical protein [Actinokineospora bangkokensis]|uniref:Secreted protein n=1 Tax=Actinokineospora bangkokensis TaxID=1193682 RepID=A0A1Q9LDE6_9PSEU|nr:hypothetical protein [Actinokineospora bangkokensis]OLR90033.1 hypothetical protein BJP25_03375 [Actinokineospora bangkokensis]
MARGTRSTGAVAVASAAAAALTLAAVAFFTVSSAGCADAGEYVQRGPDIELVGSCLDTQDLPAAPQPPAAPDHHAPAGDPGSGIDRIRQVSP